MLALARLLGGVRAVAWPPRHRGHTSRVRRSLSSAVDHSEVERPRIEKLPPTYPTERLGVPSWRDAVQSSASAAAPRVDVLEELPGMPVLKPGNLLPEPGLRITTLPNGLRVATQETYGQVATFALFLEAGSMHERPEEVGVCHFLETLAFKASERRSSAEILALTQDHGIGTGAVFNREVLMLKVDTLRSTVPLAVELLADAVLRPAFSSEDFLGARQTIAFQKDEAVSQPHALATDQLFSAAYGAGSAQGRPEKCPEHRIAAIDAAMMRAYAARNFIAPRMVLSAVGVDHDTAVAAARAHFSGVPSTAPSGSGAFVRPRSPYVGGDVRTSPDWDSLPATVAASMAKTEFTHTMLAFPTVGWSHDDVVSVCVVDTLLGGGSSFSAGGPGKGMYSRLYREVLNAFAWVESANAFSTQLYDSGLVGIFGAAPPEHAGDLASLMCQHLVRLCDHPVKGADLARARNQLQSSVLMNLETRGLLVEDIGRQILSHGKRLDPSVLSRRIQAVTPEDIIRIMRAALSHPPSLAAVGDVTRLPEHDAFRDFFSSAAHRWAAPLPGTAPMRMGA